MINDLVRRALLSAAVLLSALAGAFSVASSRAAAEYPERPVTLIVPWGPGGGTDSTARIIGSLLEAELGQPVNVVNRAGGNGVVGHAALAAAKPDGYTIGVVTVEIGMMHRAGLTKLTWRAYAPIALYNLDPAGVTVRADSDWRSVGDVVAAIRAAPGVHKAAGSGYGGIWHLALIGLLRDADLPPTAAPWVPTKGAAPALRELVAGGVDIVTTSVAEASSLAEAGRVKTLAVMSAERLPAFPEIPTLKEAMGADWEVAAWRGIAAPKGIPAAAHKRLTAALQHIYTSDAFVDFMAARGFGLAWRGDEAFADWMEASDASLGDAMEEVGLAP